MKERRTGGNIALDLPGKRTVLASYYDDARNVCAIEGLTKLGQYNRLELSARFLPFCHLEGRFLHRVRGSQRWGAS
jgi:hypothetical protein